MSFLGQYLLAVREDKGPDTCTIKFDFVCQFVYSVICLKPIEMVMCFRW